jgi:L-lactate permease
MLALQTVGATAGHMVCINNIIGARTVVGGDALRTSVGAYIQQTAPALALMLVIGTAVALVFFFI